MKTILPSSPRRKGISSAKPRGHRRRPASPTEAIAASAKPLLRLGEGTNVVLPTAAEPATETHSESPIDAFQMYIRDVGQTPLLTPEDEITLARRIRRGDAGAREQMIKANLRLVVKIAREYEGCGVPLLDLINEGNLGLMKGVERFDPSKGAKFATYAAWWIKQAIRHALSYQSRTIRLPIHVVEKRFHIRRAQTKLHDLLGRDPTDAEIAAELGLESRAVRFYRDASPATASLDAPLGEDGDQRVADMVADEQAVSPFDQLREQTDAALMRELVGTLDPRERMVVEQRFGLGGDAGRTLAEIGEQFGLTRERIRQIEELALVKLRQRMAARELARN